MNYTFKIDLTKIDKTLLFKSEKTGRIYLDGKIIETPNSEFGNSHMVVQIVPDADKDIILGNAKELKRKEQATEAAEITEDDGLPF